MCYRFSCSHLRIAFSMQVRRVDFRPLFALIPDQPFRHGPVPAHLAQQVVEQDGLPHRSGEQLLGRVLLPTQPAHERLELERKPVLRLIPGTILPLCIRRIE